MTKRSIAILWFLAAACHHATTATPPPLSNAGGGGGLGPHELMATLQRTACLGWCPVYTLRIYRDGVVEYQGDQYVIHTGAATGHLDAAAIDALDRLFADNHYFELKDAYDNYEVTDNPSATTTYSLHGKEKHVEHYMGDSSAPGSLTAVEDGIDKIVNVEQWIGTEAEREKAANGR